MPMVGADLTELNRLVTRLAGRNRSELAAALDKMNVTVQESAGWWIGELESILAVRRAPTAVVFVGQASYLAALHGFIEERVHGFLEERIDRRGLHYFTLRTAAQAVEAVAALADPGGQADGAGPALGEPGEIPGEVTEALRELGPGVTRLEAYHSRPAGTRRIQVSVLVRPGTVSVVRSAFGVAPARPRFFAVNGEGLRQVLGDALSDPGGDSMSETTGPHYRCPVCGYPGLDEPPRTEESGASYEICPSCGFEFGVTDEDRGISYEQWRREWIAGGMKWWRRRRPPAGWDPRAQLRDLEPLPAAETNTRGAAASGWGRLRG